MKRATRGAALTALVLATITGCTVDHSGDGSISRRFGSDYLGFGGDVTLTDTVEGDAVLAGGRVSTASEVKGDLVVAGGELSVGGAVDDDLYAAGGSVQLDAIVSGSARMAGGEVAIGPATVVERAVSVAAERVRFDGSAHDHLKAFGDSVRLNGEVDGDVDVRAEDLVIGPATRISGRLVYHGPTAPEVADGAVIAGGVEFHQGHARHFLDDNVRFHETRRSTGSVVWFVGVFVAAGLCLMLFPRFLREAAAAIGRQPWQSLGLGLAILVCVPFVGVFLLITVIGIPLALLMIPMYFLLLYLGWITAALFIAQRVLEAARPGRASTTAAQLLALFLGLLALWLLRQIPYAGGLIAGIGALAWQAFSGRRPATA
jgi:hypothetical protein